MQMVTPAIGCTPMAQEISFSLVSARMRPPIAWTQRGVNSHRDWATFQVGTQQCCYVTARIETLSQARGVTATADCWQVQAVDFQAMVDKKRGVKANCANVQKAREVTAQQLHSLQQELKAQQVAEVQRVVQHQHAALLLMQQVEKQHLAYLQAISNNHPLPDPSQTVHEGSIFRIKKTHSDRQRTDGRNCDWVHGA
ncbi:hypothetical protein HaLaN_08205 [Haematococcus lacustris]|uniref:Uncharacterized protein n=1 Tax=Haematococcus lacustris TaxID=44745 RepID=A0A699YSF9_HAELA|nr:hypothetical protein HaLaN_08205 [Haematococcus lacustris]